jgi:predicted Zn-dependent protease
MRTPGLWITAVFAVLASACATSPTGRNQLLLIPPEQMAEIGQTSFEKLKEKQPVVQRGSRTAYVRCVADRITPLVDLPSERGKWDVVVVREESANAFALPGGHIGVHSGMLDLLDGQDELATIIAHEVAHLKARHGAERVSQRFAASQALGITQALVFGEGASTDEKQLMSLLGLGVQVGVILPYSRTHEREADLVGLDLMARAGFDPRASVDVWQAMQQRAGGRPPEWLSTHPHPESRIEEIRDRLPKALELYREARDNGRSPRCG